MAICLPAWSTHNKHIHKNKVRKSLFIFYYCTPPQYTHNAQTHKHYNVRGVQHLSDIVSQCSSLNMPMSKSILQATHTEDVKS